MTFPRRALSTACYVSQHQHCRECDCRCSCHDRASKGLDEIREVVKNSFIPETSDIARKWFHMPKTVIKVAQPRCYTLVEVSTTGTIEGEHKVLLRIGCHQETFSVDETEQLIAALVENVKLAKDGK